MAIHFWPGRYQNWRDQEESKWRVAYQEVTRTAYMEDAGMNPTRGSKSDDTRKYREEGHMMTQ